MQIHRAWLPFRTAAILIMGPGLALPVSFDSPTVCMVGSKALPYAVAVADFNRDGHPDLAVANAGSNSVSILLYRSDRIFRQAVNYSVGTNPQSVAVGDFNGDGKVDLAVANNGSNNVSILLGNGDGTFQPAVDYLAGASPSSVVVADFNGDGKLDLAVVTNSVAILLGNGDGTFQPPVYYAAGKQPVVVAVGDFNGDGKPDLAVANYRNGGAPGTIAILLGNGDATFQRPVYYAAGLASVSVAVADLYGDGKLDLTVANYYSDNVSILRGNGDGTFQPPVNYTVKQKPEFVAVGDFNGDGKPDLAVSSYLAGEALGTLSILLGNGDGTFQPAVEYMAPSNPIFVAVGDFNADGRPDLAVPDDSSSVWVLFGNGHGGFHRPATTHGANTGLGSLAAADFNKDGYLDLAVADDVNNVAIMLGNGRGGFQPAVNYVTGNFPSAVAVGDFNNGSCPKSVIGVEGLSIQGVPVRGVLRSTLMRHPSGAWLGGRRRCQT